MTTDEEIAYIESQIHGMSYGHVEYPALNQRFVALRAAQKIKSSQASEQSRKGSENQWYKKPLGLIFIGTAITVLGTAAIYVFRTHLGIPL